MTQRVVAVCVKGEHKIEKATWKALLLWKYWREKEKEKEEISMERFDGFSIPLFHRIHNHFFGDSGKSVFILFFPLIAHHSAHAIALNRLVCEIIKSIITLIS